MFDYCCTASRNVQENEMKLYSNKSNAIHADAPTDAPAEPVVTAGKATKEPAPKRERVKQNGIARPASGGVCAAVWEWLDAHPGATIAEAKAASTEAGRDLTTTSVQFYRWRKFNGIVGRQVKPEAPAAQ